MKQIRTILSSKLFIPVVSIVLLLELFALDYTTRAGFLTKRRIHEEVEPILKPYFEEVLSYIKMGCSQRQYNSTQRYRIGFEELTGETIGQCFVSPFGYEIQIDEWFFMKHNESIRFQLIAHEMTHCLLDLDHVDDIQNYMNKYLNTSISKKETIRQLKNNIKVVCGGNND